MQQNMANNKPYTIKTEVKKMSEQAQIAIRAAKNRKNWGRTAAMRYVMRKGGSMSAYRLACQLGAVA